MVRILLVALAFILGGCDTGGEPGNLSPTITSHPSDVFVFEYAPFTLTVAATGDGPLAYRWRRAGVDIPEATGASYTKEACKATDDSVAFTCVVSNDHGSIESNAAYVWVTHPILEVTCSVRHYDSKLTVNVGVRDSQTQAAITDALVTMNGTTIPWMADSNYVLSGIVPSSGTLNMHVEWGPIVLDRDMALIDEPIATSPTIAGSPYDSSSLIVVWWCPLSSVIDEAYAVVSESVTINADGGQSLLGVLFDSRGSGDDTTTYVHIPAGTFSDETRQLSGNDTEFYVGAGIEEITIDTAAYFRCYSYSLSNIGSFTTY